MDEVFEHEASIGRAEPVADACLGLYRPRRSGSFFAEGVGEGGGKGSQASRDRAG